MNPHELILLSPYRYPGQHPLTLADEDAACWLNAYSALWHPAVLWQAQGPPRCESQYEHEQPRPGCIYALTESPPLYMADDWAVRVNAAGSITFQASPDRDTTLANLQAALDAPDAPSLGWKDGMSLFAEERGLFFGIGFGFLLLASLAEAMEHDNLLDAGAFWEHIQQAIAMRAGFRIQESGARSQEPEERDQESGVENQESEVRVQKSGTESQETGGGNQESGYRNLEEGFGSSYPEIVNQEPRVDQSSPAPESRLLTPTDDWRQHLRWAGEKLLAAREVLYPVTIHLLDLYLLGDQNLADPWPPSLVQGNPFNILASGSILEKLADSQPDKMSLLRERLQAEQAEVCGGLYQEREDPLLPLDSQLWNLHKGQEVARRILDKEIRVFGSRKFGFHPQLPLLLSSNGLTRCLFLTFEENCSLPQYQGIIVSLPSPDGKQVDAFIRNPHPVDSPQTFFNLGHYWFKTTREDHTAALALVHKDKPAAPWYADLMFLAGLTSVMGRWNTFTGFFNEVMSGEHISSLAPDDFHCDYLSERINAQLPDPVSGIARHTRLRRQLDTCWTLAALYRSLAGSRDTLQVTEELKKIEDQVESGKWGVGSGESRECGEWKAEIGDKEPVGKNSPATSLSPLPTPHSPLSTLDHIATALAERLQVRASENQPGYMVLNPCSFTRRLALELEGAARPLPIGGPVKACQLDGNLLRVVVEVPPLGFAWIAREGPPGTPPPPARLRLADAQTMTMRNEFFEVEIDKQTGGLKGMRDHKTRINRLGHRLVFNPGSTMQLQQARVTSSGPALGEVVVEGSLVGGHEQVLANFRQRYRVWLGRPVLEMRIEIDPVQPPAGYPWHAYYGARFAWRDDRGVLLRGSGGTGYVTAHSRPQTPDFLELRLARQSTVIFPGGLPFHQRQEGRMLDVILIPEGEKTRTFDLAIALDREQPMQTALGLITPPVIVPTTKGPPHIGASGWLFHLDASNLLLTRLHPGALEHRYEGGEAPPEPRDAITARLLECGSQSGQAEFRCVRNPRRATILDARGNFLLEASLNGDAALVEVSPNDLIQLQVEFS